MAGAIGAANIKLGADISGLLSGIKAASYGLSQFSQKVNTDLTKSYRQADTAARVFRGGLGRLAKDIEDTGKKLSTFASLPIVFGGAAAFKEFANLEKLKIGLQQYGETLEGVKELAKLPNVSVEGAAASIIQLRAVGVESELAKRGVSSLANALTAAGKSSTDLAPALFNLTQMLSTGKISAVDIKELANRIPQTMKIIKDEFGTIDSEVLNMVGPEKFVERLIAAFEKIPKVSSGAGTAMEQFQDSVKFAMGTMGEAINRAFNLTENIQNLGNIVEGATEKFSKLSPDVQNAITKFAGLVAIVGPALIGLGALIKIAPLVGASFSLMGGPISIVIGALALFITYYKEIAKLLEDAAIKFTAVNNAMKSNPGTALFAASEGGVAETTAYSIMAIASKDKREARQKERRELRAANEQARELAKTQAEAAKLAKDQNEGLAKSLKGVSVGYKEAAISAQPYIELLKQEKEAIEARRAIGSDIKPIQSKGMKFGGPELGAFAGAAGSMDEVISKIGQLESEYVRKAKNIIRSTMDLGAAFKNMAIDFQVNVGTAIGDSLGDAFSGIEGSMGNLGKNILGIFADLLSQLGRALLAYAATIAAAKLAMKSLNVYVAAAAGIAAVAAGKILKNNLNKTPRFAKGGFAYGEMNAIVGDNPNARFDPEMIAPYSKVDKSIKQSIAESGGGAGRIAIDDMVIRGEDLYVAFKRVESRNKNLRGF